MMLRLGLVGVSIHSAPLELLSALTIPREERATVLKELAGHAGFSELVYVATCNRVEFMFATAEETPLRVSRNRILDFFFRDASEVPFQPENFYVAGGIEAARHLFTVASALDSLVLGEAQILGQLKEAHTEAESYGLAGEQLQRAFQAAFHCARKVRRETEIGTRRVSMVNLAADSIRAFAAAVGRCRVALVGSGPMTAKIAAAFHQLGAAQFYFVNRTQDKVEDLAAQFGGTTLSLEDFLASPPAVDAVCTSTSAQQVLFGVEETERILAAGDVNRPLLYLDLAIPRDVATDVARIANVQLCNLETLRDVARENRRERFRAADRAREIVNEEVGRFHKQVVENVLAPVFGDTHTQAQTFAESGLDTLFAGRLEHLDPADKEAIRYWVTSKLVPSVLHMPMKAIADYAGPEQWCCPEEKQCAGGIRVHGLRLAPPPC
jgi:glutamyl-tRNA reductase